MPSRVSPARLALFPIALTLPLVAAACGADTPETASDEVASLSTEGDSLADAADAATVDGQVETELSPDEAALSFSQCMRDAGIDDFPDLALNAEGDIELRTAFQSVDREADGFREANESCREILEQTGFGGGRGEAVQSTEVQDALLEFTDCVRDAGYDVGDLTLAGRGQRGGAQDNDQATAEDETADDSATDGTQAGGAGGAEAGGEGLGRTRAEGQRQEGFGDQGARFAQNLGLDYEDPAVQETIANCLPIVEEAFADAGVGQQQPESE